MSKTILLIPSYQPTVLCCELLEELRRVDPTPIVVVDDGSGLAYRELFQRASRVADTVVLTNAVNLGKGAALKHGMNHIQIILAVSASSPPTPMVSIPRVTS